MYRPSESTRPKRQSPRSKALAFGVLEDETADKLKRLGKTAILIWHYFLLRRVSPSIWKCVEKVERLAAYAECSERQARRAIADLTTAGLITSTERRRWWTVYSLSHRTSVSADSPQSPDISCSITGHPCPQSNASYTPSERVETDSDKSSHPSPLSSSGGAPPPGSAIQAAAAYSPSGSGNNGAARRAAAALPLQTFRQKVVNQFVSDIRGAITTDTFKAGREGQEMLWWITGAGRFGTMECKTWMTTDSQGRLSGSISFLNFKCDLTALFDALEENECLDWQLVMLASYERQCEPFSFDSIPKLLDAMAEDVVKGSRPKSMFSSAGKIVFEKPRRLRDSDDVFGDEEDELEDEEDERDEAVSISEEILADLA
jgi:hypothetical protein